MEMQTHKPAQLAKQGETSALAEPSYLRRLTSHAWNRTKELASVELVSSTVVGIFVGGLAGGFSWFGALYGAASFIATLILAFVIHLLLSPRDLEKLRQSEIAELKRLHAQEVATHQA